MAPLIVGLLTEIRDAAYERARQTTSLPPVLFALDEVANIAPLPDLPSIVSEGAGQGLLTLACLQDLSQARSRWGAEAEGFLSLFGTTVVLPGIADMATLDALSTLSGDVELALAHARCDPGGERALVRFGLDVNGAAAPTPPRRDRGDTRSRARARRASPNGLGPSHAGLP